MATAVRVMAAARGGTRLALGIVVVAVLGACSVSFGSSTVGEQVAEELQDGAPEVLGDADADLDVSCDEPADEAEGATFECRSTGGPGEVRWRIVLDGEGSFDAATINFVTAAGLDDIRDLVAQEATRVTGTEVGIDGVDCGPSPIVLDTELAMTCAVTVPGVADQVEADVTLTDVNETGEDRTDVASIAIDGFDAAELGTASSAAVSVIQTEAVALGLGDVDVTCQEPADEEVGTTFGCASASSLGVVDWVVTITETDRISANTTNLIRADLAETVEQVAVESLEAQAGSNLGVENFECGPGPFVLDASSAMVCALTDPTTALVYDATLTFTDLETGSFQVNVANEPRP